MEEVSIWGWPLQTAGLLTTGFSTRSFTILSGRLTEVKPRKIISKFLLKLHNYNICWVQITWYKIPLYNMQKIVIKKKMKLFFFRLNFKCNSYSVYFFLCLFSSPAFLKWSNGKVGFLTRKANTSWLHKKWGASAIQLDPNTWILEYRQSSVLENSRLLSAAFELLKYRMSRFLRRMNEEFLVFSGLQYQHRRSVAGSDNVRIPT